MASKPLSRILDRLRSLAALRQAAQSPDRELLERFVRQQDEAAFTALVERHGPLVLAVCRRVLRHQQDAEDACQATFLVLVRKAAAIRKLNSLSSWLHGVALRISLKMRARLARSRQALADLPPAEKTEGSTSWSEVSALLDEELQRLPEKFRAPLVLCYLQAKTRDEAAAALGWKPATLKGRLEWGRKLLRQRLARRGLALSTVLLATGLGQSAAASLPAPLVIGVVRSAQAVAAGQPPAAGLVAPQAALAVHSLLRAFLLQRLLGWAGVCLVALSFAAGGWLTYQALDNQGEPPPAAQADRPKPLAAVAEIRPDIQPEPPAPRAKEPVPLERGERLVAKCGDCHTPRTVRGEPDLTRHLQGAHLRSHRREGEREREVEREREDETPDITASGRAGKWSEERMVRFLSRKGESPVAAHRLTADEARDVAAYLRSLPGRKKRGGRGEDD